MKKIISTLCVISLLVSFTGCSLYNTDVADDITQFVKPGSASSIDALPTEGELSSLSDYAANNIDGAAESGEAEETEQSILLATAGTEEGSFTIENPDLDSEGNLVCNGFKFYVPALWRQRFVAEVITENINGYFVTTYNFYYVQQDNQVQALEMALKVVPTGYYQSYSVSNGTRIVSDIGRSLEYFLLASTDALPEEFTDISGYSEVYSNLASQEDVITIIDE